MRPAGCYCAGVPVIEMHTPSAPIEWLVYPTTAPVRRRRKLGVVVRALHWLPARVEGARLLGLLLEHVEAEPVAERRRSAA